MNLRAFRALTLVVVAGLLAACDSNKTENPLSPTVAGPIEGVVISAPKVVTPSAGQRIAASAQPITLTVENATTTGVRPLKYVFEIAADAGFTNKVFTRQDVSPGTDGRTSVKLSDMLTSGRTYYWRAMAADGANSGPYVSTNFDVYTPVTIGAPTPVSPIDGVKITVLRPTLKVTNASKSGPVGAVTYNFQVSESQTFAVLVINAGVSEQATSTSHTPSEDLLVAKTYYWRVRAVDPTTSGPWSVTQSFKTPDAGAPVPTPGPTPGGGADQIVAINHHLAVSGLHRRERVDDHVHGDRRSAVG